MICESWLFKFLVKGLDEKVEVTILDGSGKKQWVAIIDNFRKTKIRGFDNHLLDWISCKIGCNNCMSFESLACVDLNRFLLFGVKVSDYGEQVMNLPGKAWMIVSMGVAGKFPRVGDFFGRSSLVLPEKNWTDKTRPFSLSNFSQMNNQFVTRCNAWW